MKRNTDCKMAFFLSCYGSEPRVLPLGDIPSFADCKWIDTMILARHFAFSILDFKRQLVKNFSSGGVMVATR